MQAKHTLVTGAAGGGKTTLLREMHARFDGVSIALTTKTNEKNFRGKPVRGEDALESGIQAGRHRYKWYGASYPSDTQTAREWAHAVNDQLGVPVQIIVDECQNTPLSSGEGALKDGLHEDRSRAIKWVPATQSPQDLKESRGYPGINQCKYISWVGESRVFQKGFIDYYSLEGLLPGERYRYHVIEPTNPPRVIYKGETKRRYA